MKLEYYRKIIDQYRKLKKRNCLQDLSNIFNDVHQFTLESIIFQECQRKTKKSYYFHHSFNNMKKYYNRFVEESKKNWSEYGTLLKIADEVDLSPALMADLILKYHYQEHRKDNDCKQSPGQKSKVKVSEFLKNPSLLEDPYLAAEIRMCVLADESYGPVSDAIRNFVGQEYENKLKEQLTKLGFPFVDEHQLRDRGYDKTPDIKLEIPIAVDGQIINWIECKASFGDEDRHKEYLKEQYWSYCNRFGPGMVIYWAGYIDELNIYKEQGIMISDKFPTEVTNIEPSKLVNRSYHL